MSVRFSDCAMIGIYILAPILTFIAAVKMLIRPRQTNGIKSVQIEAAQTAVKHMAFCRDISIKALKERCKEDRLTINEAVWSFVSVAMKRCLEFHNDTTTEWITAGLPISLRAAPKHETDFKVANELVVFPTDMRLISDLKSGVKQIQKDLAHLKTSLMPFGFYYLC